MPGQSLGAVGKGPLNRGPSFDHPIQDSIKLGQIHERDLSEQGVNLFRRVHHIPPEILISILAESTFGDIVRNARVSDVGESERLAHRHDVLENDKEAHRGDIDVGRERVVVDWVKKLQVQVVIVGLTQRRRDQLRWGSPDSLRDYTLQVVCKRTGSCVLRIHGVSEYFPR